MKREDYADWFKKLTDQGHTIPYRNFQGIDYYDDLQGCTWISEASTAIQAVFPTAHAINQEWKKHNASRDNDRQKIQSLLGVIKAAQSLIVGDKLGGLIDTIRIDTEDALLDQAAALVEDYGIAAAVLAGGALETHLKHLCDKYGLSVTGEGSISKYEGAVAQARNAGTVEVFSKIDGKQITVWGGIRNEAAHEPTKFNTSAEDVRRMIEGIRSFIVRVL